QPRESGLGLTDEVAVLRLSAAFGLEPMEVKRLVRAQIDRAGDTAFDPVGGGIFVDIDAREQRRRDIGQIENTAAGRREHLAPVESRLRLRQAANLVAAVNGRAAD